MEEEAGLGQDGLGAGEDLGDADGPRAEQHGVAPLDDPQVGRPAAVLDAAECPGREPVGMQGTAEDVEGQVGDPRSPGAHTHVVQVLSDWWTMPVPDGQAPRAGPSAERGYSSIRRGRRRAQANPTRRRDASGRPAVSPP